MLKKELAIFTFEDLLEFFPYRHIDRTEVKLICEIIPQTEYIQVAGKIISLAVMGENRSKRLVAQLRDASGVLELVWFQGINWVQKTLEIGHEYLVYGRAGFYQGMPQITHPETEVLSREKLEGKALLEPVYRTTEKLKAKGLGGRQLAKFTTALLQLISEKDLPENLPLYITDPLKLFPRFRAYQQIHFPPSMESYQKAVERLKFEELFFAQLRLGIIKGHRHRYSRGVVFSHVGELFNTSTKTTCHFN